MQGQHFAGHKNPDTQSFDDSALLNKYNGDTHKIQELTLVSNHNQVVGLSATYLVLGSNEVVHGGKHVGHKVDGSKTDTLRLENDEYITEVSGRGGDIIDSLKITTNTGRTVEVGGKGGNAFKLTAPYGQHFATLRGGLGGDLHFLDLQTQALPELGRYSFTAHPDQHLRGKRHGDTKEVSDVDLLKQHGGQHKIKQINVYYDDKFVYGLQVDYLNLKTGETVKGGLHVGSHWEGQGQVGQVQVEDDEYVTEIYGRHGDVLDFIGFRTTNENSSEFGGPGGAPFSVKAPNGRHFATLKGGLGGHVHNVEFTTEAIYPQKQNYQEGQHRRGKTHGDSQKFDDDKVLRNYPPSHKIWKLRVFHDNNTIYGVQADYFVFGPNVVVQGERHVGNQWQNGSEDVVELAADEYITELHGRHGDILDNFGFKTNKGRNFTFGGNGGNQFEVQAPAGQHFGTLAGGLGGHVHNLDFAVLPIHTRQ